jgi:hypothetical protein
LFQAARFRFRLVIPLTTVNLAAGTQSLDGGVVQLTISFVPAGGTNEWLVFNYQTTAGGSFSQPGSDWSLYETGLDAAIPLNFIAAYAELTINGVSQALSNPIFGGYSVMSSPVPGMPGTGTGVGPFVGPIPPGPIGPLGAFMDTWGDFVGGAGLDPNAVNGWTQALEFQSQTTVPEPATWVMMAIGFAGLGFAGYRKANGASLFAA